MKELHSKPLILISNDDGYQAKGINSLIDFVKDLADIVVCAPESSRSGFSRAFSMTSPIYLKKRKHADAEVWSCSGTPVDCVKLALSELLPRTPDLILGGINHGDNSTVNNHYSGTMGIAIEGCMKYIPSIAFSNCDYSPEASQEHLRPYVRKVVQKVLLKGLPKGICLNVNFPTTTNIQGFKTCRMSYGSWINEVVRQKHPHGYDYFWLTGEYQNDEPQGDTDQTALAQGYVSITPTKIDVTAYEFMKELSNWDL